MNLLENYRKQIFLLRLSGAAVCRVPFEGGKIFIFPRHQLKTFRQTFAEKKGNCIIQRALCTFIFMRCAELRWLERARLRQLICIDFRFRTFRKSLRNFRLQANPNEICVAAADKPSPPNLILRQTEETCKANLRKWNCGYNVGRIFQSFLRRESDRKELDDDEKMWNCKQFHVISGAPI